MEKAITQNGNGSIATATVVKLETTNTDSSTKFDETLKQRIEKLLEALGEGVFEKEEAIRLSLLSAIAGESIFLLGLPGVAKSLVARRLKFAFKDAVPFEYLMSRYSTPDEIFGPVSIKELQNDNYVRITEKYLPDADVAFLDEIWKAGPAIQNALLTILNEKIYRNGKEEMNLKAKGKLKAIISASNELPAISDDNRDSLDALWDRFLIRLVVGGVGIDENFNAMISDELDPTKDNLADNIKITTAEYKKWDKEIDAIIVPTNVFRVIKVIREKVQLEREKLESQSKDGYVTGYYISDRRWRKIIRIMRTSAFLNGRKEVDLMDCFLIADCIWSDQGEITKVKDIVTDTLRENGYNLEVDIKTIESQKEKLRHKVDRACEQKRSYEVNQEKAYQGDYYRLINGLSQYPAYCYIRIADYNNLTTSQQSFNLFDINSGRSRNASVYKSGEIIKVHDNHYWADCNIEMETVQREDMESCKPDELLIEAFDKMVDQIIKEIESQIAAIENHRSGKLSHLKSNLFVDKLLADIVEENFNNSKAELQHLKLDVQKIKEKYDTIQ